MLNFRGMELMRGKRFYQMLIIIIGFCVYMLINKLIGLFIILSYVIYLITPKIIANIGNAKYSSNKIEEAFIWYERACKLNSCSPKIKNFYAYALIKVGNIEKAEEILNTIIKSKISEYAKGPSRFTLSIIMCKKGNLDGAIEVLENMYKNYKSTNLYENLGYYYIMKGDYDKALEFNQEAYDYNNSDESIIDNLAQTYYLREDYSKAKEFYEKILPKNPTFPSYYYYYALVLLKENNTEEALQIMKRALNCKFSFLSLIKKEEIQNKICEIETLIENIKGK
jgi:tetratricopeptide (TPR) repeat protein